MRCLLVHDISNDLSRGRQDELLKKIRRRLARVSGRVALFPLCATDFRCRIEVLKP